MKITPFGKELRYIRIDHGETLLHMADRLAVSSSTLSSVEHGKLSPPAGMRELIVKEYGLSTEAAQNLNRAYAETVDKIYFDLADTPTQKRELLLEVYDRLNALTTEEAALIYSVLYRNDVR